MADWLAMLAQARDDYGHVVGLLWRAGPFFCGIHQGFGDDLRAGALHVHSGLLQAADAEFFAVNIFGLDSAVAVAHEQRIGGDDHRAFLVAVIFDDTEHHTTLVEM